MKRLIRPLAVVMAMLVAVVAPGAPAFAAEKYTYPTSDGGASYTVDAETYWAYCTGTLVSVGGKMNTARTKRISVRTSSLQPGYGCTLQIFPYSTSDEYDAFVAQPNGTTTTHSFWKAIHRIRVCQSGEDGGCSPYMQWNGATYY